MDFETPENGFDVRPSAIFQTGIEIEDWVCFKYVPWATYYGNMCFHAVR